MDTKRASQIAGEEMKKGRNCCQAVLLAAKEVWSIPVDENVLAAAALMGEGMGAGCVCGALSGIIMASGIRQHYQAHPAGNNLPVILHDVFKNEFGVTCCRAIKNKRSLVDKIGRRSCIKLTERAAAIMLEEWEKGSNANEDICNSTGTQRGRMSS